jgi:hypothetical protein
MKILVADTTNCLRKEVIEDVFFSGAIVISERRRCRKVKKKWKVVDGIGFSQRRGNSCAVTHGNAFFRTCGFEPVVSSQKVSAVAVHSFLFSHLFRMSCGKPGCNRVGRG